MIEKIDFSHHSSWWAERISCKNETSCRRNSSESRVSWKDIQDIQWQSDLSENSESQDINKRSDTSAKNSNYT